MMRAYPPASLNPTRAESALISNVGRIRVDEVDVRRHEIDTRW